MAYGSPPNGFQPMPQPPPLNRMYSLPPPGYAPAPFDEMGNPLMGAPTGAFGPGPMLAPPPHLQPHAFAAFPPHPYAFGPPPLGAYLNALPPEHMYAPPPQYAYGPPAWPPFAPAMPPPDATAFYPMPLSHPPSEPDKFETPPDNKLESQAPSGSSGSKSPPYQLDMPNIYSSGHSTQRANCHYNLRPLAAHRHFGSSSTNPYQTPYFHNYRSSNEEGSSQNAGQPPPNAAVGAPAGGDASRPESALSSYREQQAAGQQSGASSSTTDGTSSALLPPLAEEPAEMEGLWDVFKGLDGGADNGDEFGPEGLDLTVRGHALRKEELQAESAIDRLFAGAGFDPFGSFNLSSMHLPDLPPGPAPDLSDAPAAGAQIPLPSIDLRAVGVGAAPGAAGHSVPFALPPGVNADRRPSFLLGLDGSQHGQPVQLFSLLDMGLLDVPGIDELPMSNLLLPPHPEDSPLHL